MFGKVANIIDSCDSALHRVLYLVHQTHFFLFYISLAIVRGTSYGNTLSQNCRIKLCTIDRCSPFLSPTLHVSEFSAQGYLFYTSFGYCHRFEQWKHSLVEIQDKAAYDKISVVQLFFEFHA